MPNFFDNRWRGNHVLWLFAFMFVLVIPLFFYRWYWGLIAIVGSGTLLYYMIVAEREFRKQFETYVLTLTNRVQKGAQTAFQELPLGVIVYNEEYNIEWHNPFVAQLLNQKTLVGKKIRDCFPALKIGSGYEEYTIEHDDRVYFVRHHYDERLLYMTDMTSFKKLQDRYEERKLAYGILYLDNVDELARELDDQARSVLLARVVGIITEWAKKYEVLLRRTDSDRFIILMDQRSLNKVTESRFDILDQVRDMTAEYKTPITLSIGIGSGVEDLIELGTLAQTSLDIVLGRGGDQAAVKIGDKISFYGGRTNAMERRTRVRARVISHSVRELINESDKVMIMGHRWADMDVIGAAIGMLKAAKLCHKEGYIVLEDVNPSIHRLMKEIEKHEFLHKWFITPSQSLEIVTPRTLIVVVDTHKRSLVAEPKLLEKTDRIIVVDHHRRGEEFIDEATLVYLEPYASSASELIAELLQYMVEERVTLERMEATAMLAGIVVDTKSFSQRTGARTFEAASFLRRYGADTALIQRLLKEDLESYIAKAEMIKHTEVLYDHIAVAVAEPGFQQPQLFIAQAADTLLNMNDITASFVICERPDGKIGISARSLGKINVQVIMEKMGGGGHFSNAAVQWEGTLEEAEQQLKQHLHQFIQEEGMVQ